jgi:hypothetical protein
MLSKSKMVVTTQTIQTRSSMNEDVIVTSYVITDDVMKVLKHVSHPLAKVSDAEVIWVAVMAALYFQNHHERALYVLYGMGYLRQRLSVSRFNRRLHQLAGWLPGLLTILSEVYQGEQVFVIDSMPLPVCKRKRAWRCRKVRGVEYCGYCAAKQEKFFGWRLHLICTPEGVPVAFDLLPGAHHDLTPIHELTVELPSGARVYADKGYNELLEEASILLDTGVRLIPIRKKNMRPHDWVDDYDLRLYRKRIETANSQLESMGIARLHARTHLGFEIKVHASLLALALTNSI